MPHRSLFPLLAALLGINLPARGDVTLPRLFWNHAVLQKSEKTPVWGKAAPGEKVIVTLDAARAETTADANGKWRVDLDLHATGSGPFELVVQGKNRLAFSDILVGEVWVCSGQSNMYFPLKDSQGGDEEIARSANPMLRLFQVYGSPSSTPVEEVSGAWQPADPATSARFTAVGYYFGKMLQKKRGGAVGLIHSSVPGTPIEAWTRSEALDTDPALKEGKEKAQKTWQAYQDYLEQYQAWQAKNSRQDKPTPDTEAFAKPGSSQKGWKPVPMPELFANVGMPDSGVVWLRRKVIVTPEQAGKNLPFNLGDLRGMESIYWNGTRFRSAPPVPAVAHYYSIPAHLVKAGEATLAIRLFQPVGGAGIAPGKTPFTIGSESLADEWEAATETEFPKLTETASNTLPARPPEPASGHSGVASFLFNGFVAPLIPFALRGVIWYQGESNRDRAAQYRTSFPLMIRDWRSAWGRGDFPFYFCQIANFSPRKSTPEESALAELREAQTQALSEPATGQAILIDIGEDLHPINKKGAGERLARIALAQTYGEAIPWSGPVYESAKVEPGRIRIRFSHTGKGLTARALPETYQPDPRSPRTAPLVRNSPNSELQGFALCGADRRWKWADAKIEGDEVVVSSPEVPQPVAARYAWAGNPTCNLYNAAGLPAGPFRTDTFPLTTQNGRYP